MNDNLEHKTESELQELLDNTARILNEKREIKRREAILQIQQIAGAAGITVAIKGDRKRRGEQFEQAESESTKKTYQHPDKPNLSWNGKNSVPRWMKDLIASGREQSEFEVAQAPD